jgi:hypothetical protein
MRFHTDEHFIIGADHARAGEPCEDYASSGTIGDVAYAVVADGCSGGGVTDVGARLTCLAAVSALRNRLALTTATVDPNELAVEQRIIMNGVRDTLGLTTSDMLATCIAAYVTPEGGFVHARGDGVYAFVGYDGSIRAVRIEWPDSTPYYPAYEGKDLEAFIAAHGGELTAHVVNMTTWSKSAEGETKSASICRSLADGLHGFVEAIPTDTAYVVVFSDGISQCGVPWTQVVQSLLAFKSDAGAFAKRRMIRFVKDAQKSGYGPQDDVSYAVVKIERGENHDR